MKEIIAIVRMNKVSETKKALASAGYCGMHAMKALGRGKTPLEMLMPGALGLQEEYGAALADRLESGGRLIPKRLFTLLVGDDTLDTAVKIILQVNSSGQAGDGKIFVCPVSDAVRIRTGETGEQAL